ncbi:MAG: efflux RND transporter permease subunit [Candidatus Devosia phytovorans]|uniref:Efflux RND transporter permease subunit n=1 Tax=Candidatus Devosia phytovorans TaxID=3121372 RepID=A0AAJ6B216_9HYPH|nr:efflux RND transporter permease subunit [Devosia sp.]WEK06306.1 MAG: efflux RND transporter permease subunit [Devosia sp.]
MAAGSPFKRLWARFVHDRSIGFGLEHVGLTTLRYPRAIAMVVLAFSIFCITQLPKLGIDGDLMRIFAHSGEHYDAYEHLSDTFGTFENDIYVLVSSPRLTEPETLERVRELAFDLELNDYAVGSMSPFSLRTPVGNGGSVPSVPENLDNFGDVARALSHLQQNDPMMRNLITPDLSGMVIIMFPDQQKVRQDGTRAMIEAVRKTVAYYADDNISIELTGPPLWTSEMLAAAVTDQTQFTVWGFALGAIIALFALRSLPGALLVAATPFLAVMWTMGMVLLLFGSFSFLTIIVTTLVLVISFAESMFFVFNWLAYWRDGMEPNKAVDATVKLVGPAAALTMLTTFVSFASLALTPGQGVYEFAISGAIGTFLLFVCLMTFMPLMLKTAIRLGFKAPRRSSYVLTAPLPVSWFIASRFGRPLSIAAIVVTVLLLIPYGLIKPHFSFEYFVAKDSAALSTAEQIDDGVGGVAPLYIRVPLAGNDPNMSDADFATVQTAHRILESHIGENKVISAASITNYVESGFSREEVFESVGPFMRQRFVTDDGSQALITGFMPVILASEDLKQLVADVSQELQAAGVEGAEIGGLRVLTTFGTDQIVTGLQLDLTLSVIINIALIGFAFQSYRVALASAIPNLFPVLGTIAWLYVTGQGMQLTTVIALTIAFGIAVDDTVHFLSHYLHSRREEGRSHIDAVRHTLDRIGGAIVGTTIILCAGVIIVAFSDLPQVALFGSLFIATLLFALVGDLFILPALMVAGGKFFHPLGRIRVATVDHDATPDDPTGDTITGDGGTEGHSSPA